jgi:hypothetical protein
LFPALVGDILLKFVDDLLEIIVTTWVRVHGAVQYPVATRFTLAD